MEDKEEWTRNSKALKKWVLKVIFKFQRLIGAQDSVY